jgi:hypothetical protein
MEEQGDPGAEAGVEPLQLASVIGFEGKMLHC